MSEISSLTNSHNTLPTKTIKKITARRKLVESSKDMPKRAFESKKDRRKLGDRRKGSKSKKSLFELRTVHDCRHCQDSNGVDISI